MTDDPASPPLLPIAANTALREAISESRAFGATAHNVTPADYAALAALHDHVFGPGALTRTAYRVREGQPYHTPFCRLARDRTGTVIAFLRFSPVRIGGRPGALMLGPLAVAPTHANQGHARRLIADGLVAAQAAGLQLVILIGDLPYYGRIGFVRVPRGQIVMPGPVDADRTLAFELSPNAIADFRGGVSAAECHDHQQSPIATR